MAFHLFRINELYSNADGSVQFIELNVGPFNGEDLWQGQSITVTQGGVTHSYTFPNNLPSSATANTSVLIATQGFADLGVVTPDYIVPSGFLFTNGGTVNFANVDAVAYGALPTDGSLSIDRSGATATNSPRDFAGATGTVQNNNVTGTALSDVLTGTTAANQMAGFGGDDRLTGAGGNDTVDGGSGTDTAIFAGPRANYTVASAGAAVADNTGAEGTDTLIGIERLAFGDSNLAFDLAQGQSAGNTVRLIGAAFGPATIAAHPEYVRVGINLFDAGLTLTQVSALALGTPAFVALAGGSDNVSFVNAVYQNVVGAPPGSDAERALYVNMLQGSGGNLSQADLLAIAANTPVNESHIGLVGLQQTGVVYT